MAAHMHAIIRMATREQSVTSLQTSYIYYSFRHHDYAWTAVHIYAADNRRLDHGQPCSQSEVSASKHIGRMTQSTLWSIRRCLSTRRLLLSILIELILLCLRLDLPRSVEGCERKSIQWWKLSTELCSQNFEIEIVRLCLIKLRRTAESSPNKFTSRNWTDDKKAASEVRRGFCSLCKILDLP